MRDNVVTIVGRATEPELRFTPSGLAVCKFALGLYEGKNEDGTYKDNSFVDITVWREQAEQVAESVKKGDRVVVIGRMKQDKWENEDGGKRSKVHVIADEVALSLRWATGTQHNIEQSSGRSSSNAYGSGSPAPDDDPFDV